MFPQKKKSMVKKNRKITLLLAGGTVLIDKNKRLLTVNSEADIALWLEQMPELNLFGEIEPVFVAAEDDVLNFGHYEKMAQAIIGRLEQSSAFVVVARTDQLLLAANALGFLLQNIKKTIIFTAAIKSGTGLQDKKNILSKKNDLGLRSNLINAFQVAEYPLPSPAIMFGTRLIAAVKAVPDYNSEMNIFLSQDNNYWGRVDFGISVKAGLFYHSGPMKLYDKMQSNILLLHDLPGQNWPVKDMAQYQAIFVSLQHQNKLENHKIDFIKKSSQPVFLYHPSYVYNVSEAIVVNNCTFEAALSKVAWALANQAELGDLSKIMEQNLIGEFNTVR